MDATNLPTVLDLPAAATLLGIRLGKLIKVPTRPLLDLLEGRVGPAA